MFILSDCWTTVFTLNCCDLVIVPLLIYKASNWRNRLPFLPYNNVSSASYKHCQSLLYIIITFDTYLSNCCLSWQCAPVKQCFSTRLHAVQSLTIVQVSHHIQLKCTSQYISINRLTVSWYYIRYSQHLKVVFTFIYMSLCSFTN